MATIELARDYRCWNDCKQSGCPGHTATLTYQSTADVFRFNDGQRQEFIGDLALLEAFLGTVYQMAERRAEIEGVIERAMEPPHAN